MQYQASLLEIMIFLFGRDKMTDFLSYLAIYSTILLLAGQVIFGSM